MFDDHNLLPAHAGPVPEQFRGIGYWYQPTELGVACGPKIFAPLPISYEALEDALFWIDDQAGECSVTGFAFPDFIKVTLSTYPTDNRALFAELTNWLLGSGCPCNDMALVGRDVYLRIKSHAQYSGHHEQHNLDQNRLEMSKLWHQFVNGIAAPETPTRHIARRVKGNNRIVLEALQLIAPVGTIHKEKLYDAAIKKLQKKVDGRGKDRRRDAVTRAIDWLLENKQAFMHGEDGEQISLFPTLHKVD